MSLMAGNPPVDRARDRLPMSADPAWRPVVDASGRRYADSMAAFADEATIKPRFRANLLAASGKDPIYVW